MLQSEAINNDKTKINNKKQCKNNKSPNFVWGLKYRT